jgi:hypothetical protein
MAITEIRETIQQRNVTILAGTGDGEGYIILQKRMELQPGNRHTMMSVDFMDDSFLTASQPIPLGYEFYLSPYPIDVTNMPFAEEFTNGGPLASDDAVLFKQSSVFAPTPFPITATHRLPNDFLGALPTYNWYTPTLYATLIIHIDSASVSDVILTDVSVSWYCSVKETDVSNDEFTIGMVSEYLNAQNKLLINNGIEIQQNPRSSNFPMWRVGGIRPEFMIKANTNINWFLPGVGAEGAESMQSTDTIRGRVQQSSTMVAFDSAFGAFAVGTGDGIPDWIRFLAYDTGLQYGEARANFPPAKRFDNGNTEML